MALLLQALKTIEKKGLQTMAKEHGLELDKLPYEDMRKARTEWLAKQPNHPPQVSPRQIQSANAPHLPQ